MRWWILCLLLIPGVVGAQTTSAVGIPSRQYQYPVMRDSSAISGTQKDTTSIRNMWQTQGASAFRLYVRAHGASTCDTTDLKFTILRSPDGNTWGSTVVIDSLQVYGSRIDTLYSKAFDDTTVSQGWSRLITESQAGTTDTTGVKVWFGLNYLPAGL